MAVHRCAHHAKNAEIHHLWDILLLPRFVSPFTNRLLLFQPSCPFIVLTTETVFCIILLVWVYFCVPETKGVSIEAMDKVFGGNQGSVDLARMAEIRRRLGIDGGEFSLSEKGSKDVDRDGDKGVEVSHEEM